MATMTCKRCGRDFPADEFIGWDSNLTWLHQETCADCYAQALKSNEVKAAGADQQMKHASGEFSAPYASLSHRLLAQLLDSAIVILCLLVLISLGGSTAMWFFLFIGLLYLLLADAMPGGQSFGKRLCGIMVIYEQSGQPCDLPGSLLRNLPLLLLGPIDWLFIFSETRQRIGDRLAGTIVVQ